MPQRGRPAESVAPGQVVRFRRRLWRVDELIGQELVATPIDGADTEPRRFVLPLEKPEPAELHDPDPAAAGTDFGRRPPTADFEYAADDARTCG